MLPLKLSELIDVFDLSTSNNLIAASSPMLFSVLSENEMKRQVCYCRARVAQETSLI
jgi:hypothetical protein